MKQILHSAKRRSCGVLAAVIVITVASILLFTTHVPFRFLRTARLKGVIMGRFSTSLAGRVSKFDEYSMPGDCKSVISSNQDELRDRGFTLYSKNEKSMEFRTFGDAEVLDFDGCLNTASNNQVSNCTVTYSRYLDESIWTEIRLQIYNLQN
jgi:hypothetical protein